MYPPNNNFNVPFTRQLDGPMHPGKVMAVYGMAPIHASRFVVNLQCGTGSYPMAEIGLHISVRFPERVVVRNSLQGGSWQREEAEGGFPLVPGRPFQLLILCEMSSFKIAFNGSHFTDFYHRLPFDRLTHFSVEGDVQINNVSGLLGAYGPSDQVHNPMIPHMQPLHGGMFPGRIIRVRGRVPHDVYRFALNLQCGQATQPQSDTALHVSVRPTEGYVEINTLRYGNWESGEQIRPCPVFANQFFELLVLCDEHDFKIAFNGAHFAIFRHRMAYQHVNTIAIEGTVSVNLISVEGQPRSGGLNFVPLSKVEPLPVFNSPYNEHHHFPNPYPY